MAISQYDSPAHSEFQNIYSPIPFDSLMQAGTMKAKQYESGLENLIQSYEDTNNIKYIPNSKDEQYVKNVVIPHAKSVVDKYVNQDLSDPIIRRQMRMELNSGIDKQRVKDIQNSYEGYKQYIGEKMKLQQKNMLSPLEGTPHKNWDTSIQGTFSQLPSEWSDPIKALQERYFQGLKGQIVRNPKTGQPITDARGYYTSAITPGRIDSEARANVDTALSTPEGRNAVALQRAKFNISPNVSDRDVLYQVMLDAGHKYLMDDITGSPWTERELKDREPKLQSGQFYKVERTPVVSIDQDRNLRSTDFNLQSRTTHGQLPGFSSMGVKLLDSTGENRQTTTYYNKSILDKPEVQNLINLMPKEYKDRVYLIKDTKWVKENPEQAKRIEDDIFGKLKNTYSQIEQELQQGSYLATYYPKAVEGIPESRLNNVDNVTNYIFKGSNGDIKKVSSGNFINREFINPKTGETINGKKFYDTIISKAKSKNEDGTIAVTGEYDYEHPFVAMSNNDNFAKAYQINVNGEQYIMSGEASDYSDLTDKYKKNANKSYTLTKFNPGIPIDEKDGTLKMYSIVNKLDETGTPILDEKGEPVKIGIYSVLDKDTKELITESESFIKAYNDGRSYIATKNKK